MNEKKDTKVAIAISALLAGIVISLLSASERLPSWFLYPAIILLIIQTYAVISISTLPEKISGKISGIIQKRKGTKLLKMFFNEFQEKNFVGNFYIGDPGFDSKSFHRVIMLLIDRDNFRELRIADIEMHRKRFTLWEGYYQLFNGKDASICELLIEEFNRIISDYYDAFVIYPLRDIDDIIQAAKEKNKTIEIEKDIKKEWAITIREFGDFEKKYNEFVKRINKSYNRTFLREIPVDYLITSKMIFS